MDTKTSQRNNCGVAECFLWWKLILCSNALLGQAYVLTQMWTTMRFGQSAGLCALFKNQTISYIYSALLRFNATT